MLRSSVASEELPLTTMISSGGRVWRRSELIASLMDVASLCAGISTITPGAGGRRGRGGVAVIWSTAFLPYPMPSTAA
jgi:hypothetical protein